MLSNTKTIGTLGELAVAQDLIRRGYDVYAAFGDCTKIDLIGCKGKRIVRFQVKTTVHVTPAGTVCANGSRVISRTPTAYEADDFDYLAVHVLELGRTAYVPLNELCTKMCKAIMLRVTPGRNRQTVKTHPFENYEFIPE